MRVISFVAMLVVTLLFVKQDAIGQTKADSKPTAAAGANSKYKEAKDLIRRARTLLGDFIKDNPTAEEVYVARLQLATLENIFATDIPVAPVKLRGSLVWRVLRVATEDAHTRVTLEIENTSETDQEGFITFDEYPLVVVASKKVYAMKKGAVKIPRDVTRGSTSGWTAWMLQPTQAVQLDLYFDALDEGVPEGIVKYGQSFGETAARFSLLNSNQRAEQE